MRLKPQTLRDPAQNLGGLELLRLRNARTLDALPDVARNACYPPGGFVQRLADELGVSCDELLEWGRARSNFARR